MADDRTLYAGDLTSDHINKTIRVKVNSTTTIQDRLAAVRHARSGERTITILWFANTHKGTSLLASDNGYTVGHTEHVTVVAS